MNKHILLSALLCPLLISASDNNKKPKTKGRLSIPTINNAAHYDNTKTTSSEEPAFEQIIASAASLSLSGNASTDKKAFQDQAAEKHGILEQSDNVVFFMGGGQESSNEEECDTSTTQDKGKRRRNRNALRASTFGADTDEDDHTYANEDDLTSSIPHDERKGTALDERTGLPLNHLVNSDQFFN